jgi:hypothetical protein
MVENISHFNYISILIVIGLLVPIANGTTPLVATG